MINLGTFGEGKSKVQFQWRESSLNICAVTFKTKSRIGVAHILREFRRAKITLRKRMNEDSITSELASPNLTFEYIASNNPKCIIKTHTKKNKIEPYKKEYLFNWRINGYVTIQQLRRIIKKKGG